MNQSLRLVGAAGIELTTPLVVDVRCQPPTTALATTTDLLRALLDGTDTSRTISESPELGAAMRIDHKKGTWNGCS